MFNACTIAKIKLSLGIFCILSVMLFFNITKFWKNGNIPLTFGNPIPEVVRFKMRGPRWPCNWKASTNDSCFCALLSWNLLHPQSDVWMCTIFHEIILSSRCLTWNAGRKKLFNIWQFFLANLEDYRLDFEISG